LGSTIETIDSVDGIQKIYINNNTGDTIFIYGQVPVTTTTTYNKITYNYFHLLDIPLLLGYTYKNESNNFSFGFEAGALINISTKTKGEIMTPDNEFYDMKADNLNWFKDNIGVSFSASVNVAYHLNENFQIYLAPTARLESVFSTEANPIEQKHGSLGVNIGARYFIGY
jgi:predicted 3-demethylubiquinone-9 3-methyltransferase (glyoxalase superfamily)